MDYQSFRNLVQQMMDAQRAYFDARKFNRPSHPGLLGDAKALESLVRKELANDDFDQPQFPWDAPGQPEKPPG